MIGVDLIGTSAAYAAAAGVGSALLPAIGVAYLAYELYDML